MHRRLSTACACCLSKPGCPAQVGMTSRLMLLSPRGVHCCARVAATIALMVAWWFGGGSGEEEPSSRSPLPSSKAGPRTTTPPRSPRCVQSCREVGAQSNRPAKPRWPLGMRWTATPRAHSSRRISCRMRGRRVERDGHRLLRAGGQRLARAGGKFQVPVYARPDDIVQVRPDTCARATMTNASGIPKRRQSLCPITLAPRSRVARLRAGGSSCSGSTTRSSFSSCRSKVRAASGSRRIMVRLGYAAKNGHSYTSIGKRLLRGGEGPPEG